jgi:hypothetical protein
MYFKYNNNMIKKRKKERKKERFLNNPRNWAFVSGMVIVRTSANNLFATQCFS